MSGALVRAAGDRVAHGVAIGPSERPATLDPRLTWIRGGHPSPDAGSAEAGTRAMDLALSASDDDALIVLLSGGASALMALPLEGITLDEKSRTTSALLAAGADIHALNTVRKHVSRVKGGRLAAACRARTRAFVLSDVVGNDLSVIGSGPTVADPSSFSDALNVVARFDVRGEIPSSIRDALDRGAAGAIPETPKPGSPLFARTDTRLIGSLADALGGAAGAARARGYDVAVIAEPVVGEARLSGRAHVDQVMRIGSRLTRPACIISGGETTVTVRGSGRGGRNQEFILAAAAAFPPGVVFAAASVGTDGIDGPTDAAGAMIDPGTLGRLADARIDIDRVLAANDSFTAFDAIGDLIRTGPTRTNVGDVQIVLIDEARV
jgi:glycerate 2-kinase